MSIGVWQGPFSIRDSSDALPAPYETPSAGAMNRAPTIRCGKSRRRLNRSGSLRRKIGRSPNFHAHAGGTPLSEPRRGEFGVPRVCENRAEAASAATHEPFDSTSPSGAARIAECRHSSSNPLRSAYRCAPLRQTPSSSRPLSSPPP